MRGFAKLLGFAPPPAVYPSGTRLFFDQDNPPTGWTRDTTATLDDRMVRIVVGARADGGSWTISGLSGETHSHVLTDVPAHNHSITAGSHYHRMIGGGSGSGGAYGFEGGCDANYDFDTGQYGYSVSLGTEGEASPPTSSTTPGVSSDGTWRPLYRGTIIAIKD